MTRVLLNETTEDAIATDVRYASTWWERIAGLIPRAKVEAKEGLWFERCSAIHTMFMRTAIDVLFLDSERRVIEMHPEVKPNRALLTCFGAANVVELGAGAIASSRIRLGDRIRLV